MGTEDTKECTDTSRRHMVKLGDETAEPVEPAVTLVLLNTGEVVTAITVGSRSLAAMLETMEAKKIINHREIGVPTFVGHLVYDIEPRKVLGMLTVFVNLSESDLKVLANTLRRMESLTATFVVNY